MSGRTFLLQDWVTVRSSLAPAPFVQDPSLWLDLFGFSDATAWIDVAEVTTPSGSNLNCVQIGIETAPSCDDSYFSPMAPVAQFGIGHPFYGAATSPVVVRSAKSPITNNLMRYLRWKITPGGLGAWDLTFRIRIMANRSTMFVPPLLPGCAAWYRADLGLTVTANTTSVTAWNDQSGTGDPNKNLTSGTNKPAFNLADTSYNGQSTISFTSANKNYLTSGAWANPLVQPDTWVIVGHNNTSGDGCAAIDGNDLTSGQNVGRNPSNQVSMSSSGGTLVYSPSNHWTTPSVVLAEFNGNPTPNASALWFNNLTASLVTGNAGSGTSANQGSLSVGSSNVAWNAGGANCWNGTIAEIIGYSGLLSASSKAQLRNYLRGRYGLTIG
jgi:hypothetical protein